MAWFGSANAAPADPTKPKFRPLAPGPLDTLAATLPPDTTLAASTATTAAQLAAKRARQRAGGSTLLTSAAPALQTPAVLAPKSLLGS